jgi:hypothetical protein
MASRKEKATNALARLLALACPAKHSTKEKEKESISS